MNHTRNLLLIAACFAFIFVGEARAQTNFYLGGGPSIHADLPHGALNATVGLCDSDGTNCLLLNYSARGTAQDLKANTLTYSSSAAVRRVMASAVSGSSKIEFFLLGNAGASIAPTATGFSGAMGGGITYHPARAPNWGISFAGQGEYSPVNPGWRPNVFLQAGYTFKLKLSK